MIEARRVTKIGCQQDKLRFSSVVKSMQKIIVISILTSINGLRVLVP